MAKDSGGHGSEGKSLGGRPSRWHVIDTRKGQKISEHGPNSRMDAVRHASRMDYVNMDPGRHTVVPHWGDPQKYAKGPRSKFNMSTVLEKHAVRKKVANDT